MAKTKNRGSEHVTEPERGEGADTAADEIELALAGAEAPAGAMEVAMEVAVEVADPEPDPDPAARGPTPEAHSEPEAPPVPLPTPAPAADPVNPVALEIAELEAAVAAFGDPDDAVRAANDAWLKAKADRDETMARADAAVLAAYEARCEIEHKAQFEFKPQLERLKNRLKRLRSPATGRPRRAGHAAR